MSEASEQDYDPDTAPEDKPGEPGAEGGSRSPSTDTPPAKPAKDSSEVGDTDQHSNA